MIGTQQIPGRQFVGGEETELLGKRTTLAAARLDFGAHPTDAKWDESEHPRDDNGRFGKKPVAEVSISKGKLASELKKFADYTRNSSFESAYIMNFNGDSILVKSGSSSEVVFTESEISLMKGAVLTHNHPNGGSFSRQDVYFAFRRGLSEIHVAGDTHDYTLKTNGMGSQKFLEDLISVYHDEEQGVLADFRDKINSLEMSIEQANHDHAHAVLLQVSKRLRLDYTWRVAEK